MRLTALTIGFPSRCVVSCFFVQLITQLAENTHKSKFVEPTLKTAFTNHYLKTMVQRNCQQYDFPKFFTLKIK